MRPVQRPRQSDAKQAPIPRPDPARQANAAIDAQEFWRRLGL